LKCLARSRYRDIDIFGRPLCRFRDHRVGRGIQYRDISTRYGLALFTIYEV
jgi:hypothetical protein